MFATVFLIFTLLVLCGVVKYVQYINHMESYFKHLKKQTRRKQKFSFLGNMNILKAANGSEFTRDIFNYVLKRQTPLKGNIGPAYFVALDKPEDVKTVLMSSDCYDKPYEYSFLPLPQGIVTERCGATWKPVRKLMNPMFNQQILQSFLPIFSERTQALITDMEKEIGNPAFNILNYAAVCTLDSICSTVMGLNIDLKSNKGKDFIKSLEVFLDSMVARFMRPWLHLDFLYKWTNAYKTDRKHLANIRYFTNRVFEERSKLAQNTSDDYYNNNLPKKTQLPILQLYLEGKLTEEMVKQNIETLLMAGFETTASAISYAILMVAIHQDIQEQVFAELRSAYDSPDEQTTYDHIQKMPLLDRVLKEAMRLFPIAYMIGRTPTADIHLDSCVIPKGIRVTVLIYTMHRRKEIWGEDAEEFNPDHFLPENVEKRHPFSYLPFSGGPRNCIGYKYAMFSMKTVLSAVLRNYKISTDLKMSDLKVEFEIALKLANKHMVQIERRKW